jgi:hypothetical protein
MLVVGRHDRAKEAGKDKAKLDSHRTGAYYSHPPPRLDLPTPNSGLATPRRQLLFSACRKWMYVCYQVTHRSGVKDGRIGNSIL